MKTVLFLFLVFAVHSAYAQHGHSVAKPAGINPLSFAHVLSQQLTDPELKEYKMESSVMTIAPGGTDTVTHRHDCELFGYVLEGSVLISLDQNAPKTFAAGEMFFEKRNILHTLTRNGNNEQPARVLLIFIIKNGRAGYTRVY